MACPFSSLRNKSTSYYLSRYVRQAHWLLNTWAKPLENLSGASTSFVLNKT